MKALAFAGLVVAWTSIAVSAEPENPLRVWSSMHQGFSSTGHPPISVTAYLKRSGESPVAAFKLTNLSTNSLTLYRSDLPWGNPHSLRLAAMTTDGELVPNVYFCALPGSVEVTIGPGQSMEGDYELGQIIQFSRAPKGKDIVVLWSYQPNRTLSARKPMCTGVLVVPHGPRR